MASGHGGDDQGDDADAQQDVVYRSDNTHQNGYGGAERAGQHSGHQLQHQRRQ